MAARLLILIAAIAPLATCFTPTAELPDLLTTIDGRAVTDAAEWNTRRTELQMLVQEHILGYLPSGPPPTLTSARALNSSISGGISSCYIRLAFAANETDVQFDIELAWPTAAFSMLPVMATQWNHRSWGIQAVQRGYMMLLYPGADARDASGAFRAAYPTASFRKILARAFVASRALDFLLTPCGYPVANLTTPLPAVDAQRVSITGHSRNGKQSIIAAAFDKRIFAVVGSSPGTPVASPVRFSSPDFNGETTNFVSDARDWWLPSLKTYFGREHELPADGHMIVALVAPRHLMLATARSDGEGDATFADEQNIMANQRVWSLLGAPSALHIKFREGRHHGFDDPQIYVDWFDFAAGAPGTAHLFKAMPLPHAFDFAAWKRAAASTPSPPASSAPLAQRVAWLLGSGSGETSTGRAVGASSYAESGAVGTSWDYKASLMMRDTFARCETNKCVHNVTRLAFSFGAYITASLFVPCSDASCSEVATPLPVVIFLHGFSYQLGFTGIYDLYNGETNGGLIKAIVQQRGVAVLAFDLTGHGARQTEAHETFYRRFRGGASRLAAMVGAVQSALDFVRCSSTAAQALPECSTGDASVPYAVEFPVPALDERKVFVLGYSLGSVVALHAAAMLPQIAGVAAFSGWTPFRTNTGVATGGNALLYERHALIPRLGLFAGNETAIPYDYAELIAAIAPRPCLLHAPLRNRFAVPADVGAAAKAAAAAWGGNASAFTLSTPNTSSDFRDAEITAALHWIERFVQ